MRVDLTPLQAMILDEWARLWNAAHPQLFKLPPRPKGDSGITWDRATWRPQR